MNHQARISHWLAAAALIAPAACDDGESERRDEPTMQEEGFPCFEPDQCVEELSCVATEYTLDGEPLGVCARDCTTDSDCDSERCFGDPASGEGGYCANVVEQEYDLCGVAETAVCAEGMVCLLFPDLPLGVCVHLCPIDGDAAPSGDTLDEDAGVGMEAPAACGEEQSCVADVLANPDGNGVCGTFVARDEECGIAVGLFCADEDVCAPEDPASEESTLRCFQRCDQPGTECEQGTCTLVGRRFAYCL